MGNGIFNSISNPVCGDAERQRTVDGSVMPDEKMIFYVGADGFSDLAGMVQWNFRQDQNLFAAPAAYMSVSVDMGPDDLSNFF